MVPIGFNAGERRVDNVMVAMVFVVRVPTVDFYDHVRRRAGHCYSMHAWRR